jgi:hypothetical protein
MKYLKSRRKAILAAFMLAVGEAVEVGCRLGYKLTNDDRDGRVKTGKLKDEDIPGVFTNNVVGMYVSLNRKSWPQAKAVLLDVVADDSSKSASPMYGIVIQYKGETVRVTMDEIMAALRENRE